MDSLAQQTEALAPRLRQWRRDFHHYAESGWVEFRTASLVARELDALGWQLTLGRDAICADARMGLPDADTLAAEEQRALSQGADPRWLPAFSGGFTGLVATLETGKPGPVFGFRVDMDALDLSEQQTAPHRPAAEGFASCNPGMMHACGHDGHTAIGLGLAQLFSAIKPQLCGTIKLLFQPAEEGTRGARAMVEAGVVDDVDYFTAIHIGTGVPPGEVVCGSDNFMATTKFDALFRGIAAHAGGNPEQGRNALLAAAQAALALHAIAPHSQGPSRVNVGVMQAGSGRNVVPAEALLKVETRGASEAVNEYVFARAREVIEGAALSYGVQQEIRLMGAATSSHPSPQWVEYVRRQAARTPGVENAVARSEGSAGSEDATLMMARVQARGGQATYMVFGATLSAGHHHPCFDFDESVMTTAVHTLASLVVNFPHSGGL